MREYVPTVKGKSLAAQTGLEGLANRLYEKNYDRPLYILDYLTRDNFGWRDDAEDMQTEVRTTRAKLKSSDEVYMFDRALSVDPETDSWRRIGDYEDDTLFPVRALTTFAKASEEDSLILSGAAGLSLVNFRQRCPLLSRNRYQEFGFRSFNEACAFVGGYVVGRLVNLESSRLLRKGPSFEYEKNGVLHAVSVGGSFHGDFRMSETRVVQSDIVSPIHTMTEFSPQKSLNVAGYHSVESEIVATLIEAEFIRAGKTAAMQLVDEFVAALTESTNSSGRIDFRRGAFADYGDGDVRYSLTSLKLLLADEGYNPLRRKDALHSSPYLPQSSTMLEIVPTATGVKFQNRDERQELDISGINIDREYYVNLLRVLIGQTSGGLGRTSPTQLLELVYLAKSLLDGNVIENSV